MNVKLARFTICTAILILFLSIGLGARAQSTAPANRRPPRSRQPLLPIRRPRVC